MTVNVTKHVIIMGNVQGVSFRAWTERTANGLGLDGMVRNLPNGSVEALFHGSALMVNQMVDACKKGPSMARVDDMIITDRPDLKVTKGFIIL